MNDIRDKYIDLTAIIRKRFDAIHEIRSFDKENFYLSETVAFHGRKIIEAIPFLAYWRLITALIQFLERPKVNITRKNIQLRNHQTLRDRFNLYGFSR